MTIENRERTIVTRVIERLAIIVLIICCTAANAQQRFYMDFSWQESTGVNLAMDEARRILSEHEDARIEFFVHGKDIKMFSKGKT